MIKQEMITMMHYDNLLNPPPSQLAEASKQAATASGAISSAQQKRYMQQVKSAHEAYLRETPFGQFDEPELKEASLNVLVLFILFCDHVQVRFMYTCIWFTVAFWIIGREYT